MTENIINIAFYLTYFLLGISVLLGFALPLINAFGNPKSLIKGLYGLLMIGFVFGVAYVLSGSEVTSLYTRFGIGSGLSKIIGAGLISMYLLMILSFVGIFVTEFIKIFK